MLVDSQLYVRSVRGSVVEKGVERMGKDGGRCRLNVLESLVRVREKGVSRGQKRRATSFSLVEGRVGSSSNAPENEQLR